MKAFDPVRKIFNRVASEHPAPTYVYGYEMELWPDGAIEELGRRGLLVETTNATTAECSGCEWKCSKSVMVRPLPDKLLSAFIRCDEEPGHGRIPVSPERLRRFHASLRTVAKFTVDCFELPSESPVYKADRIGVGTLNGRNGSRLVSVVRDPKRILLQVGHEVQECSGLIRWSGTDLIIDQAQLRRLADRQLKPPSRAPRESDGVKRSNEDVTTTKDDRDAEIARIGKKLKTRGRSWGLVSEEIARMPFVAAPKDGSRPISPGRIRRILADRDKT